MRGVRLEWDGKTADVPRLHLPLQVVETVNAPRADRGTLLEAGVVADDGWQNQLIWGDNLHVLSSLVDRYAGQVDLVYIDPPFDSRQDYKVRIAVGEDRAAADQDLAKIASVVEEKAYRDTWGKGEDSYLQMLYSRLILLRELLSDRGSLFLHLAPNVSHRARVLLDEIFPGQFRAEIIWKRTTAHADTQDFGGVHDVIACFSKADGHIWKQPFEPYDQEYVDQYFRFDDGDGERYWPGDLTAAGTREGSSGQPWRGFDPRPKGLHWRFTTEKLDALDSAGGIYWPKKKGGWPQYKRYLKKMRGMPVGDIWTDIKRINQVAGERLGYDTQKPEALLERIIKSSSDEGSIVLDCFVGSGTTAAVAEKLGRRWIACDVGRFAVHTTRKRLLGISGCKPFVVANLGRYERQVWQQATTGEQVRRYLDFVIELYHATPVADTTYVHGALGQRAVHVGSVESPVSAAEIVDAADEAGALGYRALDVLGWEFDMGLHELVQEEARARGVDLRLRRIPREVMDPRAVASGDVVFHELAYVKVDARVKKRAVEISLLDFVLPNPDLVPASVRDKITGWSDYIDYWAVDFTYGAVDADTFHNQWQSYRTRAGRVLELTAQQEYDEPGAHVVLVKVIDIFGNDTTARAEVTVR
ncbi:MAG: site-specific DNA-methyltransferase [Mycobacteriales bacterium]